MSHRCRGGDESLLILKFPRWVFYDKVSLLLIGGAAAAAAGGGLAVLMLLH